MKAKSRLLTAKERGVLEKCLLEWQYAPVPEWGWEVNAQPLVLTFIIVIGLYGCNFTGAGGRVRVLTVISNNLNL